VADLPLTSLIAQNQAPRTHVVPPRSVEYHREPDPAHQSFFSSAAGAWQYFFSHSSRLKVLGTSMQGTPCASATQFDRKARRDEPPWNATWKLKIFGPCNFTELTLRFLANLAAPLLLKWVCEWLTNGPKLRAQSSAGASRHKPSARPVNYQHVLAFPRTADRTA
jgi:hypothetical protein